MGFLLGVLILFSLLFVVIGVFTMSEATAGVGLIAMACFFGILARMVQANIYNRNR